MIAFALAASVLALVVACTALTLVLQIARPLPKDQSLPTSTFLLTADQRASMAPEVQARVFKEETLARVARRR